MVSPGQHSVSARPRADESLTSFIFRLAARRRLRSAQGLAKSFGFYRYTNQPARECLEGLAASAQVPLAELEAISFGPQDYAVGWFRGVELPTNVFDRRGAADRRVCPHCMEEHRHHRAIWDLMFIAVCPVHAVRLADTCRTCGRHLQWIGSDLTRCACQADLVHMAAEKVSETDLRGTKVVHGLLGDMRFSEDAKYAMSLAPFRDLRPGKVVEFLFRIGLELLAGRPKVFSLEQTGELAWEAHVALSRGLEVAENWPAAFYDILEIMRVRSNGYPSTKLQQSVGVVERWLDHLPVESGLAIRSACAEFRVQVQNRSRNVQGT